MARVMTAKAYQGLVLYTKNTSFYNFKTNTYLLQKG